jgi:hypothetical protein
MPVILIFNYYSPLNLRRTYLRRLINHCKYKGCLGVAYWDGEWEFKYVPIVPTPVSW